MELPFDAQHKNAITSDFDENSTGDTASGASFVYYADGLYL